MNGRSIIFKEIWSQDQGAFYITKKPGFDDALKILKN